MREKEKGRERERDRERGRRERIAGKSRHVQQTTKIHC